jgi:mannitol-1-/sugar-/sorbitol-6-/2-deoxyglucose-6-phosphatase
MIEAVIFDMDGLLVDSEPFWRAAEMKVFGSLGIQLTEEQCRSTTGMRVEEVVFHWSANFPGKIANIEVTANQIVHEVMNLIEQNGKALPGVHQAIDLFVAQGLPLAIASASSYALIHQVVKKLGVGNFFQVIQSAEHMQYGKPHPEVFLTAADLLQKDPTKCLVLEDSIYGVIAAKAARMKVVAVPDSEHFERKEYVIADAKLRSLADLDEELLFSL